MHLIKHRNYYKNFLVRTEFEVLLAADRQSTSSSCKGALFGTLDQILSSSFFV
jgi:hypothetical protein